MASEEFFESRESEVCVEMGWKVGKFGFKLLGFCLFFEYEGVVLSFSLWCMCFFF